MLLRAIGMCKRKRKKKKGYEEIEEVGWSYFEKGKNVHLGGLIPCVWKNCKSYSLFDKHPFCFDHMDFRNINWLCPVCLQGYLSPLGCLVCSHNDIIFPIEMCEDVC
jgi:hypothetical protein